VHAVFAALAALSMLGAFAGLTHLAPAPGPRTRYALALGLVAGCALALALA
jgi:hypothetical protein